MYYTRNTNTVVALAQAETGVKLGLQVGARLTDILVTLIIRCPGVTIEKY